MSQRPKRRRTEVNYRRLNEGIVEISQTHPHTAFFHADNQIPLDETVEPDVAAFFNEPNSRPLPIPKCWFNKLDMEINSEKFSPRIITSILGEDREVPVMDSVTQQGMVGWTLGRWRDYLELPESKRRQLTEHGVLNLISLEFSGTELAEYIKRPAQVVKNDLLEKIWPPELNSEKPKVQLYSLTSAAHGFTDFHLDFAGTSVFYHVVYGRKSFIFVRPTESNLRAYEKWCDSNDQQATWFPSTLKSTQKNEDNMFQIDLKAGDSLLIPSGWIHAVYTPEDSSVVGGNFLTENDMAMQIRVNDLELRTKVPETFRFPQFDRVLEYFHEYKSKTHKVETEEENSSTEINANGLNSEIKTETQQH